MALGMGIEESLIALIIVMAIVYLFGANKAAKWKEVLSSKKDEAKQILGGTYKQPEEKQ